MTTYPLSLPSSFKTAQIVVSMVHINSVTESKFTFETQAFRWIGERWVFDVSIPPTNDRDTAEEFIAFALQLKGKYGTFLMGDPSFTTPRGSWGGTPLVKGASQTGNQLVIDGAPNSITDYAVAGDYIQVGTGSSSRLYKVLENANSDSSGNVTLLVSPDIRNGTADNAAITTTSPRGLFRMDSDTVSWSYDSDKMFRYSFRAIEAL